MTTEVFLEHIRAGQAQEEALKKHWGGYRAKEVDEYVEKLLSRMRNMEAAYQERYEEMRTGLLGMTRERDEQRERVRALERQLEDTPQRCEAYLKDQGLITLPKEEYEQIQNTQAAYRRDANSISEKQAQLKQEIERLIRELKEKRTAQQQAEETIQKLEQALREAQARAGEAGQLKQQLQAQAETEAKLQARLEVAEAQSREQAQELAQAQAQYQMLELQHQLARQMTQQLMEEKERHEKEAAVRQERSEAERASLVHRYKGILRSQHQCLQRMQESFAASVRCMESLGEAGMLDRPAEEAKPQSA